MKSFVTFSDLLGKQCKKKKKTYCGFRNEGFPTFLITGNKTNYDQSQETVLVGRNNFDRKD